MTQRRRKDAGLPGNGGLFAAGPLTDGVGDRSGFPGAGYDSGEAEGGVGVREFARAVDERLSELYGAASEWWMRVGDAESAMRRMAGQRKDSRTRAWSGTVEEALQYEPLPYEQNTWAHVVRRREDALTHLAVIGEEQRELEDVYEASGRWSRAFLVDGNDGHVHSTMKCSSCYPTTRFVWLPQYSGADEAEIVGDAGRSACTRCYPTAPVDVLSRPSKIVNPNAPEPKTPRGGKQVDPAKPAVNNSPTASGEPLRIPEMFSGDRVEVLKTERAAVVAWNDSTDYLGMVDEGLKPGLERRRRLIEEALAQKHGVSVEEQRAVLEGKYAKRRR